MKNTKLDRPAYTLTVGELLDLLRGGQEQQQAPIYNGVPEPQYLYSIRELAEYLKISTVTAMRLKTSGKIRFVQFGRKLIFNTLEIMEDLKRGGLDNGK